MVVPRVRIVVCIAALVAAGISRSAPADVELAPLWTHDAGGAARAEIVAYDAAARELLVTSSDQKCVRRLKIESGEELGCIDVSPYGAPTSVAAARGLIAVAVPAPQRTAPGVVVILRSTKGAAPDPVAVVRVGPLPDMIAFTPDGRRLLVANEGEPSDDYKTDPEGSISVVDLRRGPEQAVALTADFLALNSERESLVRRGVRLLAPGTREADGQATVAADLEPEYIAVAADGQTAWVTLQENNALAEVDVAAGRVTRVVGLGLKDHSRTGQGLDASDRDGVAIRSWPVWGMYQPDGIAAYQVDGVTYLVTANEGDTRNYGSFADAARVADLPLDGSLLRGDPELQADNRLGRLHVSRLEGDLDQDGDVDRLLAFGGRSLAIWTADGQLIYDSGDALERAIAARLPDRFNNSGPPGSAVDSRSPDRGPEPEGVVVGRVGESIYALVGLERTSAIAVFDVTRPRSARLVDVVSLDAGRAGARGPNIAPEGLAFIAASESPLGEPLLAVACEVSGTTVLYRLRETR